MSAPPLSPGSVDTLLLWHTPIEDFAGYRDTTTIAGSCAAGIRSVGLTRLIAVVLNVSQ
jgi:hypothetical protein